MFITVILFSLSAGLTSISKFAESGIKEKAGKIDTSGVVNWTESCRKDHAA